MAFTSCSSDDNGGEVINDEINDDNNNNNGGNNQSGDMVLDDSMDLIARIDGTPFDAVVVMPSGLQLSAQNSRGEVFIVTLPEDATIGTHAVGEESGYKIDFYRDGNTQLPTEGTMTLTRLNSDNEAAKGTFELVATSQDGGNTVTISEGAFVY